MLTTIPDDKDLKSISSYGSLDQLLILKTICHDIYIARNISMNQEKILDSLRKIDKIFVDSSNYN
jgi:hypothetical protein